MRKESLYYQNSKKVHTFCSIVWRGYNIRLLPREEPEVGEILKEVFEDEGITVVEGRLSEVKQGSGGKGHTLSCKLSDNTISEVSGDTLLLSLGRTPNVGDMGLDEVGINADETGIQVNEKLETTVQGIYAAGDCTGGRQL